MLVSDNARALEVIKSLSDEYSRKIVLSIIARSLPIEDISKEQHIPISTCYRRMHELLDYGIVRADKTVIQEDGKKFISYRTAFKNATINLESGELKVDVEPNRDPSDRLKDMWATVRQSEKPKESKPTEAAIPLVPA